MFESQVPSTESLPGLADCATPDSTPAPSIASESSQNSQDVFTQAFNKLMGRPAGAKASTQEMPKKAKQPKTIVDHFGKAPHSDHPAVSSTTPAAKSNRTTRKTGIEATPQTKQKAKSKPKKAK